MKYFCLLLLCCLICLKQCFAACPTPPAAVPTFSESKFTAKGTWYVVGSNIPTNTICRKYTINSYNSGTRTFNVNFSSATTATDGTSFSGTWTESTSGVASFTEKFLGINDANTRIIETDYTYYAVRYTCTDLGATFIEEYQLLSPNSAGFTTAKNFAGCKIPSGVTVVSNTNNCPNGLYTTTIPTPTAPEAVTEMTKDNKIKRWFKTLIG